MISFLDLKRANENHENEIVKAIENVVRSGWYVLGNEVREFEKAYARFCGVDYCVGVGNGLDAIRLIFRAYMEMGVLKPGDEVIVPSNTYIATILAVADCKLTPVWIEPNINTYNIDPIEIEKHISPKTKAIMLVHLYGRIAFNDRIIEIATKNGLLIVEDAAQSHGAGFNGKMSGGLGNAGAFSFYPTKNLGAVGDAGAVTSNNAELVDVVRALANYGSSSKYVHTIKGLNSRLDEIQAAVLNVKLKYLLEENLIRQSIATHYLQNLKNPAIILPSLGINEESNWHLFVIRSKERDRLKRYLFENGIETQIHYPVPPHDQMAFSEMGEMSFPLSEQIHREVLSLPLNIYLTAAEQDSIISAINNFI